MQGLSAQDLIDFAPVYRCLHIYSVLVSSSLRECHNTHHFYYVICSFCFLNLYDISQTIHYNVR